MGSCNMIVKKVIKHGSFNLDIQLAKSWIVKQFVQCGELCM
jgi:hypothetical protein